VFSKVLFSLFNDPEGPNLLIVTVMAIFIYTLSAMVYRYNPLTKQDGFRRTLLPILTQAATITVLYFFLK
jgi:hypothetical protein